MRKLPDQLTGWVALNATPDAETILAWKRAAEALEAENARLRAEREQLMAQPPFGYACGEWLFKEKEQFDSYAAAYMVGNKPEVKEPVIVYARPIPAQQSPAVADCGHLDPWQIAEGTKCDCNKSPAVAVPEQKPAYYVNVPAGDPDGAHQFLKPAEWAKHFTRCLFEPLYRAPLLPFPRVAEQDMREIITSAMHYFHPERSYQLRIELWFDHEGRTLLTKLNEANHAR